MEKNQDIKYMPSPPTLANLRQRLANAEERAQRLMFETWVLPKSPAHYRTPHLTAEGREHTRLFTQVIPNLKRQINAREARNKRVREARARQVFRKYARKLMARIYRPPNAGGAMYRKLTKRNVGTSISPNRVRSTGSSPSPKRTRKN